MARSREDSMDHILPAFVKQRGQVLMLQSSHNVTPTLSARIKSSGVHLCS